MTLPGSIHVLRLATTLCGLVLLAACSVLPKRETLHVWRPPATAAVTATAHHDFSLRLDTPHVTGPLDATTIMVLPAPGRVSTYKGARWSDTPALLVRQRLVDAFMAAKLTAVTTDDDAFLSDYTLSGDLRAFQTEYRAGSPTVVVRYDAQLHRGGSLHLIATRSFTVTESPTDASVPEVVIAFGAAEDELAKQVVTWTLATTGNLEQPALAPHQVGRALPAEHAPRTRGTSTAGSARPTWTSEALRRGIGQRRPRPCR